MRVRDGFIINAPFVFFFLVFIYFFFVVLNHVCRFNNLVCRFFVWNISCVIFFVFYFCCLLCCIVPASEQWNTENPYVLSLVSDIQRDVHYIYNIYVQCICLLSVFFYQKLFLSSTYAHAIYTPLVCSVLFSIFCWIVEKNVLLLFCSGLHEYNMQLKNKKQTMGNKWIIILDYDYEYFVFSRFTDLP